MRILRDWKAFAFLGSVFGVVLLLLFAFASPMRGRVTAAPTLPFAVRPVSVNSSRDAETASFSVRVKGENIPYRVFGLFLMPGERVLLQVAKDSAGAFEVVANQGRLESSAPDGWSWTAPTTQGLYPVSVVDHISGDTITLNAFVLVPYRRTESLEGYRIGYYQQTGLATREENYAVPRGFIEVTAANQSTQLSPHFTLGQFVAKQSSSYPKFLVLQERLLLKLELLLDSVQARGIHASTFKVMSGYRTPFYNRSIGNRTRFSRHLYGDAADIFIDENGDGQMDDLNGDRLINRGDADFLADIVEQVSETSPFQRLIGGLGLYRARSRHGPFIHVDVRGFPIKWTE
ncbi:MAG: D-Ala-D-Ala carboxypeptidase family metallohydrolase [Gemmatimonadota bacterium]